ncbi:hypothetical protein Bbelb_404830 [Branchiostoma belcheri]|nr:hypothetical protein Bbelb_404830 [Branchiostoma belcheri]
MNTQPGPRVPMPLSPQVRHWLASEEPVTSVPLHQNWKNPEVPPHCPNCDVSETTNHYLYHCPRYDNKVNKRHHMLLEADSIHETYNIEEENRDTDIVHPSQNERRPF